MKLLPRLCMATGHGAAGGDNDKLGAAVSSSSGSSSSTGSSSSSSAAAAAVSEASSSTSLPSLPSLSAGTSNAASFAHLKTLLPLPAAPSSPAVVAADSSHGFFVVARPATVALHDLSTLESTSSSDSSIDDTATAGSVKCVACVQGGGGGYAAVTGHQDGRLRLWRVSTRAPGRIRLAAALPTVSDRVRRFPLPSNHVPVRRHHRRLWIEHSDAVSGVAASADGRLLFSVSWDKTLKVWAVPSLRCLQSLPAHDDAVNAVAVAPGEGGVVYTGSADRRVRVWAPRPPTDKAAVARSHSKNKYPVYDLVATLSRHTAAVNAVAVGCGGQVLYSGGNDRCVVVWEKEDSASHMVAIGALRGHRKAVLSVACAGDGMVVSGSADRTVRAWRREADSRAHACVAVFDVHRSAVRSVAVAVFPEQKKQGGDGEEEEWRVCSASFDGEVRVWSLRVTTGL
ncbi:protein JINGUBANG [Brachypodium distachyon]|uniref:Uncharacterized protein n=1 Tax=Brachypodium distachyon TaxID=15368 RepID=I1IYX4_BRADI|nr:protein JINGUBANG [Brachypodium distachyon]KQJ83184.1 hypothetical protein BRADI_5g13610v3 [Brachypodium distachyon]|eukprot:XP_003579985.1 protein JINGUBANG [Brachypodium distachyon]